MVVEPAEEEGPAGVVGAGLAGVDPGLDLRLPFPWVLEEVEDVLDLGEVVGVEEHLGGCVQILVGGAGQVDGGVGHGSYRTPGRVKRQGLGLIGGLISAPG